MSENKSTNKETFSQDGAHLQAPDTTPVKKSGKVVKAFRIATGLDAIEGIIKNVVANDISAARDIKDMAIKVIEKPKEAKVDSNSSDISIRFSDAMKQYEVSEADLVDKVKFSAIMCNVAILCVALIIASMIAVFPYVSGKLRVAEFLIMGFMATALFVGLSVKWGFWNYQLRERKLFGIKDYLDNPSEWLPKTKSDKPASNRGRKIVGALSLIAALSLGIPSGSAMAQGTTCTGTNGASSGNYVGETFALPCEKDLYRNALETIFPNVGPLGSPSIVNGAATSGNASGPSANTNGQAAISEAFMAFITVLMTAGSSVLLWHIVSIIVSVAHEGTSLQQKWAGFWPWMRMFLGASMLAPYTKGFCLAQVLVLYAALWGGSLGNIIWTAYLNGLTEPKISSNFVMPYVTNVLRNAEVADVCYNIIKHQAAAGQSSNMNLSAALPSNDPSVASYTSISDLTQVSYVDRVNQVFGGWKINVARTNKAENVKYTQVMQATWDFGPTCGRITMPYVQNQSEFSTYDKAKVEAITKFISTMDKENSTVIGKAIGNDQGEISQDVQQDLINLYGKYQAAQSQVYTSISTAAYSFLNTVNNGYLEKFKENASTYGWVEAGSFYMNISRMQSLFDNFLSIAPSTDNQESTNSSNIKNSLIRMFNAEPATSNLYDRFIDILSQNDGISSKVDTTGKVSSGLDSAAKAGNFNGMNINTNLIGVSNPDSMLGGAIAWIENECGQLIWGLVSKLTGLDDGSGESNNGFIGSELQNMTEFGQNLLSIAGTIIVLFALGSIVSLFAKASPSGWLAKAGTAMANKFSGGVISKFLTAGGGMLMKFLMWAIVTLLIVGAMHAYVLPMMPYIQSLLFFMSMMIIVVEAMVAAPIWAFMHLRLDGNELIGQQQQTGYMLIFNLFLRVPLAMLGMLLSISVFNATVMILSITFYPAMTAATGDGGTGIIGSLVMLVLMSYLHYQIAVRSFSLISSVPARVSKWFGAGMTDEQEHSLMTSIGGFIAGQASQSVRSSMANAFTPKQQQQEGEGGQKTPATSTPGTSDPANISAATSGGNDSGGSEVAGSVGETAGTAAGSAAGSSVAGPVGGYVGGHVGGAVGRRAGESAGNVQMPGGNMASAINSVASNPDNKANINQIGGQDNFKNLMGSLDTHLQNSGGSLDDNGMNALTKQFAEHSGDDSGATKQAASKLIGEAFKQFKELQ